MSEPSRESSDLAFVSDLMRKAVSVMEEFPAESIPPEEEMPESESSDGVPWKRATSVREALSDPRRQAWLEGIRNSWPQDLMPVFLNASSILAQILEMFGVRRDSGMMGLFAAGMADPENLQLMMALTQLKKETAAEGEDNSGASGAEQNDPLGMQEAFLNEIRRRSLAYHTPFARTLTTLLGQDALLWLTADSQDGVGKIQPHEFSRTGWSKVWAIENQLAIEQELLKLEPEAEYLGKIVVALSWTLAALASFIQPAIFAGEGIPHLSSLREGQYTVSVGTGTHTLVTFQPAAMLVLVRILAEGLLSPLLSAADLMWIGAGLARVREVRSGFTAISSEEERFALFLSHRGRDAKRPLAEIVQTLPKAHGVFLDCLTLPRGVVNRSFIYGSLARAERIVIVDTENFQESAWCRKEAWFADTLSAHGLVKLERLTLPQSVARVTAEGPGSSRRRPQQGLEYPITPRVLRDIDYWARKPNLYSLKEAGHPSESLEPLQAAVEETPRPDDPAWVRSIGETVKEMLSRVVETAPDAEPFDLWATALQYALAAFGSTSNARSKMEVRRGVDQLNGVLKSVVTSRLHRDEVFLTQAPSHLALIAAASAISLAGFELDPRMTPALRIALGDTAGLHDGLLLLDMRQPGARRAFRLQLIAILVQSNLGSVGIVQDAADEVHQSHVDTLPLEVLPCVTLYPGMEAPFGSEINR